MWKNNNRFTVVLGFLPNKLMDNHIDRRDRAYSKKSDGVFVFLEFMDGAKLFVYKIVHRILWQKFDYVSF